MGLEQEGAARTLNLEQERVKCLLKMTVVGPFLLQAKYSYSITALSGSKPRSAAMKILVISEKTGGLGMTVFCNLTHLQYKEG